MERLESFLDFSVRNCIMKTCVCLFDCFSMERIQDIVFMCFLLFIFNNFQDARGDEERRKRWKKVKIKP